MLAGVPARGVVMVPKLSKQGEVLRRLCLTRIETARTALAARAPGDTRIHRARQQTKRARALLHLLRDALGEERTIATSHALRDVNRALAGARDAAVLAALVLRVADDAGLARREVRSLHARFEREVERQRTGISPAQARRALAAVSAALRATALDSPGDAVLAGFLRIYRSGRRGYAAVAASARAEPLHDWRKHVIRYWYVLEVLSSAKPRLLRPLAREAHRLAELLGDHNDRSLLASRVRRASLAPPVERALLRALARQCATLRTDALAVGTRLYGPAARRIAGPVEAWWKEWPGPE